MNRTIAFALAVLVGALTVRPILSQEVPDPTRFGFVNIQRLVEEYWKRENIQNSLQARSDALKTSITDRKERLQEMSDELATLNPDSDEYRRLRRQLELLGYEIDLDQKDEQRRLERDAQKQLKLLYKDVVRECQAFGESRGYAAILKWEPLGPKFEDERADLEIVAATRGVLWQDERLDVTDEVLEFLNASKPR